MIDQLFFAMILVVALYIVLSKNLKYIIIASGVLSLFATFCYLIYSAPDVALAEAIIGCSLSTILYIIALKKYRSFYIFLTSNSKKETSDFRRRLNNFNIMSKIDSYCHDKELQVHSINSWTTPELIEKEHVFDLILENKNGKINIFYSEEGEHIVALRELLTNSIDKTQLNFVELHSEEESK